MNALPVLKTDRLLLLPAAPELARRVADYYTRNRAFLRAFEPARPEAFFTAAGQRADLAREEQEAAACRGARYFLELREQPGTVIGCAALNNIVLGSFRSAFLGYKMDEALQGRGYMTEAVGAVTEFAFAVLRLHRVEANVMPRNGRSLRVLQKCGYRPEGLACRYLSINGVWEDHIHMVRLNEERQPSAADTALREVYRPLAARAAAACLALGADERAVVYRTGVWLCRGGAWERADYPLPALPLSDGGTLYVGPDGYFAERPLPRGAALRLPPPEERWSARTEGPEPQFADRPAALAAGYPQAALILRAGLPPEESASALPALLRALADACNC